MAARARMNPSSPPDATPPKPTPVAGPAIELIWVGFGIAIFAALLVAWTSYRSNDDYAEIAHWVSHSQLVIQNIEQARSHKQSALDAADAYWRDGNSTLFDQLQVALIKIREDLSRLGALVADNHSQLTRVRAIEESMAKLDHMAADLKQMASAHDRQTTVSSAEFIALRAEVENVRQRPVRGPRGPVERGWAEREKRPRGAAGGGGGRRTGARGAPPARARALPPQQGGNGGGRQRGGSLVDPDGRRRRGSAVPLSAQHG